MITETDGHGKGPAAHDPVTNLTDNADNADNASVASGDDWRRQAVAGQMTRALRVVLGEDRRLDAEPRTGRAAEVLTVIQGEQAACALRGLRDRHREIATASREFSCATVQAVRWADALAHATDDPALVDRLLHRTLVAALTRRLAVDGRTVAEQTVAACHQALLDRPPFEPPRPDRDAAS